MIRRLPEQVNPWTHFGAPHRLSHLLRIDGQANEEEFVAEFATAILVRCTVDARNGPRWYIYGDAYWSVGDEPTPQTLWTMVLDVGLVKSWSARDRDDRDWEYSGDQLVHTGGVQDPGEMIMTIREQIDKFREEDLHPSVTAACGAAVTVGIVDLRTPEMRIAGTGVIASPDGLIATCRHVVEEIEGLDTPITSPSSIGVLMWHRKGRETSACVMDVRSYWVMTGMARRGGREVPTDATDLAILDLGIDGMPYANFLESCSAAVPGQSVLACGYPMGGAYLKDNNGVRQRMPFLHGGLISAERNDSKGSLEQLTCDLPLLLGSSGSPIFLTGRAELIGIVSHVMKFPARLNDGDDDSPLQKVGADVRAHVPASTCLVLPIATIKHGLGEMKNRLLGLKPRTTWEKAKLAMSGVDLHSP